MIILVEGLPKYQRSKLEIERKSTGAAPGVKNGLTFVGGFFLIFGSGWILAEPTVLCNTRVHPC